VSTTYREKRSAALSRCGDVQSVMLVYSIRHDVILCGCHRPFQPKSLRAASSHAALQAQTPLCKVLYRRERVQARRMHSLMHTFVASERLCILRLSAASRRDAIGRRNPCSAATCQLCKPRGYVPLLCTPRDETKLLQFLLKHLSWWRPASRCLSRIGTWCAGGL
jgi:hypothetical protein